MSMPGLDVMATEDTVGAVLWAWATDTRPRIRAMIARRGTSLVNLYFSFIVKVFSAAQGFAARSGVCVQTQARSLDARTAAACPRQAGVLSSP